VAEIQMALAMLVFLVLDGHHLMLRASLQSYEIVGLGKAGLTAAFSQRLIEFTAEVIKFGVQIAAPVAVALFAVNVAFGIVAKAMPQLNVLVLSFAVTALIGLFVMLISQPEFQAAAGNILGRIGDWMQAMLVTLRV
jgi:flagellar biosynthesis protein FliR